MKKIVLIVLTILLAASLTLTFTACKNNCAKGEHDMQLSSTTEATCTADKVEHYKCANCTHTEDRAVADTKLGHDFANGSVVTETPATCKGAGSKTVKCARCNETQTSSVGEATNHSYKTGEYHNANDQHWQECEYNCGTTTQKTDCTYTYAKKDAIHHTATCSVCHNSVDKPHSWVKDGEEIAATCEHGTITNYKCVCGQTKQEEADDKLNHEFTQDVATVSEATCTAKAVHTFKCAHCKQTENREVGEMLPHTYTLNKFSNTEHWKECQCGAKTDVAAHVVGALVATDEHVHCNQCTGCEKRLNEEAHAHNVYDKTADGHTSVCKCGRELSAVQPHTYDDDDVICKVCGYSSSNANFVVKINGAVHEYETITAAFASVKEGDTALIVMGKDVYGDGVDVPGGRNITWRLNGHTYTVTGGLVGSANTVSNCIRFLAGSNITILNGTITADESLTKAAILVQNYADLTLNNVTLDASNMPRTDCNYALSVNNGRVQLIASTLKAASRDNAVALDLYYGLSSQYTKVEVLVGSGCTLIGAIEYGSAVELDDLAGKADLIKPRFNNTIRFYGYAHCGNANIVIGLENGERLTHDAKTIDGIDATCTEDGLTDGSQCARCGKILVEQQVIPANGHDWNEWQDIDGTHMRDCKNCDAMQEHVAAMSDWSESDGKHFHSCTVDGCTYSEQHAIEWELYDDTATCTQAGIKIYICMHNGCDCEKEEDSPVKPHEYEFLEVKTPATCTENAVETYKCKHCEATEDREKENSALGHDVTTADYVGDKQHTGACTHCNTVVTVNCSNYDDDKAAACTVCGHQRTEQAVSKALTIDIVGITEITRYKDGGFSFNGASFTYKQIARANDTNGGGLQVRNSSGNVTSFYNTTAFSSGIYSVKIHYNSVTSDKHKLTIKVATDAEFSNVLDTKTVDVNNTEFTLTQTNGVFIKFEAAGSGSAYIDFIEIFVGACGHYWNKGEVITQGDCETDGEIEYTCLDCGEKKTETVKATGHKYAYHESNTATTEHAGNKAYYSCENCDLFFDGEDKTVEIEKDSWIIPQLTEECNHVDAKWIMLDTGEHFLSCGNCGYSSAKCNGELTHVPNNDGTHTDKCEKAECEYSVNNVKCEYDTEKNDGKCVCGYKGLIEITLTLTNVNESDVTLYENDTDKVIELTNGKAWVSRGTKIRVEADADEIKYNGKERVEIDSILYVLTDEAENVEITVVSNQQIKSWKLVTNANDLVAGSQIIIVGKKNNQYYAMSTTQNTNNRIAVSVTANENEIEINDKVQIITLENGTGDTFALKAGSQYLYAIKGSNYLRSQETSSDWAITISNGVATIKQTVESEDRFIKLNSTSNLISCYKSGQESVSIYMYC